MTTHQFKSNGHTFALVPIEDDANGFFVNSAGCIRYSHNNCRESTPILPEQLGVYATKENCEILGSYLRDDRDVDFKEAYGITPELIRSEASKVWGKEGDEVERISAELLSGKYKDDYSVEQSTGAFRIGVKEGYLAAKAKGCYSEENMRAAFVAGELHLDKYIDADGFLASFAPKPSMPSRLLVILIKP